MTFESREASQPGALGQDRLGNPVLVGPAATRVVEKSEKVQKEIDKIVARPESARLAAVNSIRNFISNPNANVNYQFTVADDGYGRNAEMYDINDGSNTLRLVVDTKNDRVIQAGVQGEFRQPIKSTFAQSDLEARARTFLRDKNPCFVSIESNTKFEPMSKGGADGGVTVWFFRWNSSSNSEIYVQVGFVEDGSLVNYGDTGICSLSERP